MNTSETQAPTEANYYRDIPSAHETVLIPGTDYLLNPDKPLAQEDGYNVTAIIDGYDGNEQVRQGWEKDGASPDQFLLLDLRNAPTYGKYKEFRGALINSKIEFMLVSSNLDVDKKIGYKGIRRGEEINVGRGDESMKARFGLSDITSRKHFSISLGADGQLTVADVGSSNGTRVTSAEMPIMNGMTSRRAEQQGPSERSTQENKVVEEEPAKTNDQLWDESREAVYDNLPVNAKTIFDRLETSYKSGVPIEVVADVLNEVVSMRAAGKTEKQIKISLLKKWHPDTHPDAPQDIKNIALDVSKMIGQIVA